MIINEEDRKSSIFSSKSSLLEKMVNNFSTKDIELSQDNLPRLNECKVTHKGRNLESISLIKGVGEKFSLKKQINLALEKNCNDSVGTTTLQSALTDIKSKLTTAPTKYFNVDENEDSEDKEYATELLEGNYAHPNHYFQNQRIKILEGFCQGKIKRCISDESWWLMHSFDDVDLVYNLRHKTSLTTSNQLKKSRSCEMFQGLFCNQSRKSEELKGFHKNENKSFESNDAFLAKPLWISGRTADTFRFLIQWLVVSLLDIPLVILELHASSFENNDKLEEANKNAIAKICIEADKKEWTTGDLMAIISRECFQNTNESVEDCARRSLYFHA